MDTSVLLVEWQEEECTKPKVVGLSAADRKIREKSCVIVWLVGGVSPSIKFFCPFFILFLGFLKAHCRCHCRFGYVVSKTGSVGVFESIVLVFLNRQ